MEVRSVAPHAVENDRQFSGHSDLGFLEANAFGQPQAPVFQRATMPRDQLFHPASEDIALRLANDQAEVLEQATDLVAQIALDIDQQGAAVKHRAYAVTRQWSAPIEWSRLNVSA